MLSALGSRTGRRSRPIRQGSRAFEPAGVLDLLGVDPVSSRSAALRAKAQHQRLRERPGLRRAVRHPSSSMPTSSKTSRRDRLLERLAGLHEARERRVHAGRKTRPSGRAGSARHCVSPARSPPDRCAGSSRCRRPGIGGRGRRCDHGPRRAAGAAEAVPAVPVRERAGIGQQPASRAGSSGRRPRAAPRTRPAAGGARRDRPRTGRTVVRSRGRSRRPAGARPSSATLGQQGSRRLVARATEHLEAGHQHHPRAGSARALAEPTLVAPALGGAIEAGAGVDVRRRIEEPGRMARSSRRTRPACARADRRRPCASRGRAADIALAEGLAAGRRPSPTRSGPEGSSRNEFRAGSLASLPPHSRPVAPPARCVAPARLSPDQPPPTGSSPATYRPTRLSELIGQEALVRTLTNALAHRPDRARLPARRASAASARPRPPGSSPARLNCTGPDGTGRADARALRRLRALRRDRRGPRTRRASRWTPRPAPASTTCASWSTACATRPASARYKVYIIDEVHMLSADGVQRLLKTLEEPPPHVEVHLRHDRDPQGSGDRAVALPALRPAPGRRRDAGRASGRDRAREERSRSSRRRWPDRARRRGLGARRALAARPGDRAIGEGRGRWPTQVQDMLGLADRGRVLDLFEAARCAATRPARWTGSASCYDARRRSRGGAAGPARDQPLADPASRWRPRPPSARRRPTASAERGRALAQACRCRCWRAPGRCC